MQEIATETLSADPAGCARAADLLQSGALVAFPTETVYGLGADARNGEAVARIYAAKGRPSFNPLILHLPTLAAAEEIAVFTPEAREIAAAFWPGPLTLVLPLRDETVSPLVTAGLSTVALRVPAHPLANALLTAARTPVAAPSANPSGQISPTTAAHVASGLTGRIAAIIDGGPTSVGLESTIIGWSDEGPTLLRPGGLASAKIEAITGALASPEQTDTPTAPGQLTSHYAPRAWLMLNHPDPGSMPFSLGFGATPGTTYNLSPKGNLIEAAANLFGHLHALDALAGPGDSIAVAPVPDTGLGQAINDRLTRAAAPR